MSGSGDTRPGAARLRPASARARSSRDGIVAVEAFSRGDAIDRAWMGWGALRVLSRQDWVPGAVRDEGRVANMERLLLVLDGALDADCGDLGRHRVSAGGSLWISTGHGLASRLGNASKDAPLRLLEAWLQPDRVNAVPAVAPHPPPGATLVDLEPGMPVAIPACAGGRWWLEVLAGEVIACGGADAPPTTDVSHGTRLSAGDGLGWLAGDVGAPASVAASGSGPARLLLLALPA